MSNRAKALLTVGRFYAPFDDLSRCCFYCEVAYPETIDHAPALSRVMQHGAAYFRSAGVPLLLIRACGECNALLGNRPLDTLEKRALFLYRNAQKRFAHRRLTGEWTREEVNELGRGLKPLVEAHMRHKDHLWTRLVGLSNTISKYDDIGWPACAAAERLTA